MQSKVKVLLADGNGISLNELSDLIKYQFNNVTIVAQTYSLDETIHAIIKQAPDLFIIDTKLNGGTVFDVFKQDNAWAKNTIITSNETKYAQKAFEYQVVHYLLKPVKLLELKMGIQRYVSKFSIELNPSPANLPGIKLFTKEGLDYYIISDIIKCENIDQTPVIYLTDGRVITISDSYTNVESKFLKIGFASTSNSAIVNLTHVKKYLAGKITLNNLSTIKVSKNHLDRFIFEMDKFVIE